MLTKKLQRILQTELEIVPGIAGDGVGEAESTLDILRSAYHSARTALYFAACLCIGLFVIMAALLISNFGDSDALALVSAASGVSFVGLIYLMIRISREMTQSGLLIALSERLPEQDVHDAFKALLQQQIASSKAMNQN